MKKGRSLLDLAAELERQEAAKEDFIVNTTVLNMAGDGTSLSFEEEAPFRQLLPLAHRQVGDRVGIPAKYYDRMLEQAPELLATNVNHWFNANPENRMVRMMDGNIRAFLSDRYQRRDNYDLMQFLIPVFSDIGNLQVVSCEVTDKNLYLKITTPKVQDEIQKGDIVQAGIVISNSEVGMGAFKVQPLILRLVCSNGLIANTYGMSKYHVGRRIEIEDQVQELFTSETIQADDEAFFMKCRDIVKGALSEDVFSEIVNQMMETTTNKIEVKPTMAVQRLTKKYTLTQDESENVLTNLLKEGSLTQYGMMNAVTASAKDDDLSYDRATELEELGGSILTLSDGEWKELAA